MTNQRHTNSRTKQSQRARKRPTLVGQREARTLAGQLALPFTDNADLVQASDADMRDRSATGAGTNVPHKRVGAYSVLRYWR